MLDDCNVALRPTGVADSIVYLSEQFAIVRHQGGESSPRVPQIGICDDAQVFFARPQPDERKPGIDYQFRVEGIRDEYDVPAERLQRGSDPHGRVDVACGADSDDEVTGGSLRHG